MTDDTLYLRGENGLVVHFTGRDVLPEGVQHRIDRGDLVPCQEDGSPLEPEAAVPPALVPALPVDAPVMPKKTATRDEWIKFAIGQGMDREQANASTKADLVKHMTRHLTPVAS